MEEEYAAQFRGFRCPGRGRLARTAVPTMPRRRTIPLDDKQARSPRRRARDARGHRLPPAGVPVPRVGVGVNVDGVIRTPLSRGLIEEVGTTPSPRPSLRHDEPAGAHGSVQPSTSCSPWRPTRPMSTCRRDHRAGPVMTPAPRAVVVAEAVARRAGAAAVARPARVQSIVRAGRPCREKGGSGTTKPSQPTAPSMAANLSSTSMTRRGTRLQKDAAAAGVGSRRVEQHRRRSR